MKHKTKSDAQVWEVWLINKYKPKFNKLNKKNDALTINLGEENWKVYQVLNKQVEKVKYNHGCLSYILIASLIYGIYYLLSR